MKKIFALLCLLLPLSTQAETVTMGSDAFAGTANGQLVFTQDGVTWTLSGGIGVSTYRERTGGSFLNPVYTTYYQLDATKNVVYTLTFDCEDERKQVVVSKAEVTVKAGWGTTFVITDENGNQGKKTVALGGTGTAEAEVNSTAGFTFSGDTDDYNIRSITLTYTLEDIPNTSLTISENDNYAATAEGTFGTVVLDRRFASGWNTICLPFSVKASDICAGAAAQKFTGYSAENGLQFAPVTKIVKGGFGGLQDIEVEGEMEAGVPYLIWFPEDVEAGRTFKNVAVTAGGPQSVEFGDVTFTGNYETQFSMAGLYGVAVAEDGIGRIMRGGENTTLRSTRAYFRISEQHTGSLAVHTAAFGEDKGQTTAVAHTETAGAQAGTAYDLAGRRVNKTTKGLYIVGGRKMLAR
ncbi:MAG: hypothetical protein J1F06_00030 [Prevotellaceae bacterium]|nr:hypothetical protein [Prevotellaceae bacterium]